MLALLERSDTSTTTPMTAVEYEVAGRNFLKLNFPQLFGLRLVVDRVQREQGEFPETAGHGSFEWDFRAPVVLSGDEPLASAAVDVYLSHGRYHRPAHPVLTAPGQLTPLKIPRGGRLELVPADFLAIFEITTAREWHKRLLARLEARLAVTLDRARDLNRDMPVRLGILDVVAVIGVVGTESCLKRVDAIMASSRWSSSLLRTMADAARFVFVRLPYDPTGSPVVAPTAPEPLRAEDSCV